MNDISLKQPFIFFGITAAIIAAFIAGLSLFLKWGVSVEPSPDEARPELAPSGTVEIKAPRQDELTPSVIYDGKSFQPQRVFRDGSGAIGCLVVLVNRSGAPLKIGVNPHNPARDPGPDFGFTAAGDKLIFDPRFGGITELGVHDHEKPEHGFTIILGEKCRI